MKQLFCDCKIDAEKSAFFLSGRAVETGVIAPAISNDVAMAYHRCAQFKKENDALRAETEAMEKQEPVAWADAFGEPFRKKSEIDGVASPLYALPGAQGLASSQDEWKTLAKDLLREIERQTCAHEETHRGGFLWEICDACGAKWADDEGGKPEFKWPEVVEKARAMLAADPA